MVLVDTSVWSLALRRRDDTENPVVAELQDLISDGNVQMIGPIRQELLSGVRLESQYRRLRDHLRAFPDLTLSTKEYERAAECFNLCRSNGIQGSNTDFLICAVGEHHQLPIFTTDQDFVRFSNVLPIRLHGTPE